MEINWVYAGIGLVLWAIFAGFWWGVLPVFGSRSYVDAFGFAPMVILTIVLLPLSYFIVYGIANR